MELEARDFESSNQREVQHGKVREASKVGLRGTLIGRRTDFKASLRGAVRRLRADLPGL